MNSLQEKQYLNIKEIRVMLYLLAVASFVLLLVMKYDMDFRCIILQPICYFFCVFFFVRTRLGDGIGGTAIVIMYAFRMCLLPILCAYGNFYLEPDRSVYIDYFNFAILLNCFENFLVFVSLYYFDRRYRGYSRQNEWNPRKRIVIKFFVICLLIVFGLIIFSNMDFLSYFRLIVEGEEIVTVQRLQSYGMSYYLLVIVDLFGRPLISFCLTDYFLSKKGKFGILMTIVIAFVNVLFITDRRIVSILIGGCCCVQILLYVRKDIYKKFLYFIIGAMAIVTVVYGFAGTDEPYLVARKFQRYFSGPTLTAIGMAVNSNYDQSICDFLKLLFNDSIILTGLFNAFEMPNYVMELCGSAGKSIWTPMMIGSVQYFGIFAPLPIILIIWFVTKCDYIARVSQSNLYKLMMNYLSISVAIYIVMYTVDLIFYTIIFFGGLYALLLYFDRKIIK